MASPSPNDIAAEAGWRLGLYACGLVIIGPTTGVLAGAVFWFMSYLAGADLEPLQCWVLGWLVTTAMFCADVRQAHNLSVNFLSDPTAYDPSRVNH